MYKGLREVSQNPLKPHLVPKELGQDSKVCLWCQVSSSPSGPRNYTPSEGGGLPMGVDSRSEGWGLSRDLMVRLHVCTGTLNIPNPLMAD